MEEQQTHLDSAQIPPRAQVTLSSKMGYQWSEVQGF